MNTKICRWTLLLVVGVVGAVGTPTVTQAHGPRQYYSSWTHYPTANYYYRQYYYKPTVEYVGYKHHYVVCIPSQPNYLYFYNPYKKQYWGRCPSTMNGHAQYSLLAEKDRRGSISEIPENAFPPPAAMPPVPDSTDNTPLDLPPDELPDLKTPGLLVPPLPPKI